MKKIKTKYPLILSITAAVSTIAVGVLTARSTVKAVHILKMAEDESEKELSKKEKAELLVPTYIPPALVCMFAISCIMGAHVLNRKQQASLVSAYVALDKTYKRYCEKVSERYGRDVDREIKTEIVEEECREFNCAPEVDTVLFYDEYTATYFESTTEKVTEAEEAFNAAIKYHGSANISLLFDLINPQNIIHMDDYIFEYCYPTTFTKEVIFEHEVTYINDDLECWIIRQPYYA